MRLLGCPCCTRADMGPGYTAVPAPPGAKWGCSAEAGGSSAASLTCWLCFWLWVAHLSFLLEPCLGGRDASCQDLVRPSARDARHCCGRWRLLAGRRSAGAQSKVWEGAAGVLQNNVLSGRAERRTRTRLPCVRAERGKASSG